MFHSSTSTTSKERCIDVSKLCPSARTDRQGYQWEGNPTTTFLAWVEPSKGGLILIPSFWNTKELRLATIDMLVDEEHEKSEQDYSTTLDESLGIVADDYVDKLVEESNEIIDESYKGSSVYDNKSNINSDTDSRSVGTQESFFESFEDVSVLTEESSLWNDVDADFGIDGDQVSCAMAEGTIFEHVLAALQWDKCERPSMSVSSFPELQGLSIS
jgi:hypothetical protein